MPLALPAVTVPSFLNAGLSLARPSAVVAFGCPIAGVLALVDREAGGAERIAAAGHRVVSLYTAAELLAAAGRTV